ncbi:hypothetical protein AMAG_16773 [Allomyces macrogynus ATCC 38327]|uniref:Uncharacterized protein n=1 Tax=Allomyces macrogynus (strain ATCC 38327) TaxID=578462 RepID=A0A0L0TCL2_ALLM3|nr:hypothetical protein AMAG_16773 [Allomyces macrogynus ATCC 38327]|eukprot:KNE72284.1 hypothetical protein AMAG_16773 [Allomyces macrogynus ATCC 38327]
MRWPPTLRQPLHQPRQNPGMRSRDSVLLYLSLARRSSLPWSSRALRPSKCITSSGNYGPIMCLRMPGANQDSIIIADADMTADVLRANGPTPKRLAPPTWDYLRKRHKLPAGIVITSRSWPSGWPTVFALIVDRILPCGPNRQGEEWKRLRSAIQPPIFPPKNAHAYCSKVDQITAQALDVMERAMSRRAEGTRGQGDGVGGLGCAVVD